MVNFDYSKEPVRDIFMIDVKSFYASCECVARKLHPLKTRLVVLSRPETGKGGLVLSASPAAKKDFGISNVTRGKNLPTSNYFQQQIAKAKTSNQPFPVYDREFNFYRVPPRMKMYLAQNLKIYDIFLKYTSLEDLHPYSIDEAILDVTHSMNYYFPNSKLSRVEKRDRLAKMIQVDIYKSLGFFVTVGIGDNILLAKLAMDNEAKHNQTMRAQWTYQEVESKVWQIKPLTSFWGIGYRMAENFEKIGINSIKELANCNYQLLHQKFGIVGMEYFHHANGIDRSIVRKKYTPISHSLSNNQILPKDYTADEFLLILKEQVAQTIARVRKKGAKTTILHLYVGYSYYENEKGFSRQIKFPPTDSTQLVTDYALKIFQKYYNGRSKIRHIGVSFGHLIYTDEIQLDLFSSVKSQLKQEKIDLVVDNIRSKYGFTSIYKASSLSQHGTILDRASSLGGHAGGTDGL